MSGGAYSRNKGAQAERDLARFLRTWWPRTERAVRTGYRTADRVSADPGDITGIPGVVVSVKNVDPKTAAWPSTWTRWWSELDAMLEADPAALGVIVERRSGASNAASWWVHLRLGDLVALYNCSAAKSVGDRASVRISVETWVELLLASGYARPVA